MKAAYIFIWCSGFLFVRANGQHQKLYTLEECLHLAKTNNYSLKQAGNNVAVASVDKRLAAFEFSPALDINAAHIFSSGKIIDPVTNTFVNDNFSGGAVSADAVIGIFNGMRKVYQVRQAVYTLKANEQQLKQQELEVMSAVTKAYIKVLYSIDKISFLMANNQLTANELQIVNEKINVGKLSKSEFYTIDARLKNELADIATAQNDSSVAMHELAILLGMAQSNTIQPDTLSEIKITTLLDKTFSSDEIINHMLQKHPALQQNIYEVRSAEQGLKAAKANRWPQLSLEGSLLSNYNVSYTDISGNKLPVQKQLKNNFGSYTGLVLGIPLFQQWKNNFTIQKEKINLSNATIAMEQTQVELTNNIQQLVSDFYTAKQRYKMQAAALEQGKRSYEIYEEKHQLGMAGSLEMITAKDYLLTLQSKYLEARYTLFITDKLILLMQGGY